MKRIFTLLTALAALLLTACGGADSDPATDFTVATYTPRYAAGFEIRGTDHSAATLLVIRNPWQGANNIEQHLLIWRDTLASPPDDFDGQIIEAPVRRVVCMSSSHVAMFDAIGQVRRIVGVSGIEYINNTTIRAKAQDVGYDTNIAFEQLTALKPDLVLLYGVTGENTVLTGKLRELHIPYVYIGDYVEQSPLGKAEWMVAIAELCDMRAAGERVFDGIAERYTTLKDRISSHNAARRPTVMLNTPYRDTWFMPSARSFMVQLIEDACGAYIYADKNNSDTSVAIDMEEAYLLAGRADVWLNVGACNSLAELTVQNPKFADIPAVRNHRVFNNNRRQTAAGGSDFWESGVVHPDLILRDLDIIFRADTTDTLYYYKQLQ